MSRDPLAPSVIDMNLLTKIFVTLSITCGAAWLLKQVAIVATGAQQTENVIVGVLWGVGMSTFLLAAAVGTALLSRPAPVWLRLVAAIVAVPVAFVALDVVHIAVETIAESDGRFVAEIPLVLAALVMGALGLRTLASVLSD